MDFLLTGFLYLNPSKKILACGRWRMPERKAVDTIPNMRRQGLTI